MGKRNGKGGGVAVLEADRVDFVSHDLEAELEGVAPMDASKVVAIIEAPAIDPEKTPPVQWLHLDVIVESPHNTRKHFDQARLQELADSMRASGQTTPVLVRPDGTGGYELAAGHRRYRAAKIAGISHLLAIVRPMDDNAFLEILTIENLQREDVHPLEEADGYAQLLLQEPRAGEPRYTPEVIAQRVGKSSTYVYDRLQLRQLVEPVRHLFFAGRITPSHAIELARLNSEQQALALEEGLWDGNDTDEDPELGFEEDASDPYRDRRLVSVREFRFWVRTSTQVDPQGDQLTTSFPETAAKVDRAKRSSLPVVRVTLETHLMRSAPKGAPEVLTRNEYKILEEEDPTSSCGHEALGVVVEGRGQGRRAFVLCAALKDCTIHWAKEIKQAKAAAAERAKARESAPSHSSKAPAPLSPAAAKKAAAELAKQQREQAREKAFNDATPAVHSALASAIKKTSVKAGGAIELLLLKSIDMGGSYKLLSKMKSVQLVPRGKSSDDLARHLLWVYMVPEDLTLEDAVDAGKALGVDVMKIVDGALAKAESVAKAPASAAKKATPKKKGGKR